MNKIYFLFLLFFLLLPRASAKEMPSEDIEQVYLSAWKMRVEIYRIARSKLYEIFYKDFDLIQPDLADAIDILENQIVYIQGFEGEETSKQFFNQAVDVWNNLRFHTVRRLEKKDFVRFYYDTQTFDNYLKIMLEKLEDQYDFSSVYWQELKKRYHLKTILFKINIGYLARKNKISQSMNRILDQNMPEVEKIFHYAREKGYLNQEQIAKILANLLNDWLLIKYNMSNVLFSADRTIYALTGSMYKRLGLIDKIKR